MHALIRTEQLRAAFKALACLGLPVSDKPETNMLRISLDQQVVNGGPLRPGLIVEAIDGPRYCCVATAADVASLEQIIVSRTHARFLAEYVKQQLVSHQTRVEIAGATLKFDSGTRSSYVLQENATPEQFPDVRKLFHEAAFAGAGVTVGSFDPSYIGEVGGLAAYASASTVELSVSEHLFEAKIRGERLFVRYLVAPRRT